MGNYDQLIDKQNQLKWQLVVSDIDGTLLDDQGLVSPRNLEAISRLSAQGIGFTLATGRMDRMTRTYVRQLDVKLPIIACNGAVIRDCRTDEVIFRQNMPVNEVAGLIDWLSRNEYDYLCYTPDQVFYPPYSSRINNMHRYNLMAEAAGISGISLIDIDGRADWVASQGIVKILIILPDPESHGIVSQVLNRFPSCQGVLSMRDALDVTSIQVSKGKGLLQLASILQVDPQKTAVFGDNDNDVSLLEAAGMGIAMGNATAAAIAASRRQTVSNSESGVAEGIYRFILSDAGNPAAVR